MPGLVTHSAQTATVSLLCCGVCAPFVLLTCLLCNKRDLTALKSLLLWQISGPSKGLTALHLRRFLEALLAFRRKQAALKFCCAFSPLMIHDLIDLWKRILAAFFSANCVQALGTFQCILRPHGSRAGLYPYFTGGGNGSGEVKSLLQERPASGPRFGRAALTRAGLPLTWGDGHLRCHTLTRSSSLCVSVAQVHTHTASFFIPLTL